MTKIDNIKKLFNNEAIQNNKTEFFEKVAEEFKIAVSTVRTGWFSRFEIPSIYKVQETLIVYMQNYIRTKSKVTA